MATVNWTQFFSARDIAQISKAEKAIGESNILMALGDLFAMGCYLIQTQPHHRAGRKACRTVIRALKLDDKLSRKVVGLLNAKSAHIHGMFKPHIEMANLFNRDHGST